MSLIDKNFNDINIYIVVFISTKNNLKYTRTIATPFIPNSEQEGINYIKNLLDKIFQEKISICSVEWMVNAWIPKE